MWDQDDEGNWNCTADWKVKYKYRRLMQINLSVNAPVRFLMPFNGTFSAED